MVKLLGFLTILFFTITAMFFVFLTRFNDESKRVAMMSKIAGVTMITKKTGGTTRRSSPTIIIPTVTVTPELTDELTATSIPKKTLEIELGEIDVSGQRVEIKVKREFGENDEQIKEELTKDGKIPWQDFDLQLSFSENVKPGSSDNKFIFQNREFEIKMLNQQGDVLNLFMYKIFGDSIIINPEGGIWEGNTEFELGVYSDGVKVSGVKFTIE